MMKNERGSSDLKTLVVMLCLLVVGAGFIFGMLGAMEKTETQMSGNSDGMHTACVAVCRVRFVDGATDIVKFNRCITRCDTRFGQ